MSLVRELEARKVIERRQLFEAITNHLRNLGVDASLVEESSMDNFGGTVREPIIELKGRSIDRIRLASTDYLSCGILASVSRFHYEVFLDKKFTRKFSKDIRAKTKSIKDKKSLGLFGGTVVGINWVGQDLAELLNHDSEITKVLLDCIKSTGKPEFQVQTRSTSTVEILGPRFAEPQRITDLLTLGAKERFEECIFGFKICERIARHIRELASNR